jgi:hypothetical protein
MIYARCHHRNHDPAVLLIRRTSAADGLTGPEIGSADIHETPKGLRRLMHYLIPHRRVGLIILVHELAI